MLLEGRKALVFGVANERSIAYAVARELKAQGARLAFSYASDAVKKRIEPISEELGGEFIIKADLSDDAAVAEAADVVREKWGDVDIIIHSVAFANREDLKGRFIETSRDGFKLALDVSAFSLVAVCRAFEDMLSEHGSVITMTYHGSQKVITNYNVMGVAKAALEASVRYLAADLGAKGVRVNAISAGPIKTLASSGISGFKSILSTIEERAPLGRNVSQEDVGRAALYLASDLASGTTGEVIYVDSGYNIMGI
ncbi:enoyl-[acyl-carrier protein] reductase I [Desulfobaculum xiamenense]|uniref:Enoyl-[acyl-carrier-protein] reductase [NADH] n=1 Tax=Desulfobaculum xiamenense TaxID=995050 RepID=A0A846QPG7_9BACT|nr:enoyl-ACP reductase [Desulfobaculum xiamenense]NJB67305.1 enoyl-[acyl-carrier protein] reductase I [Desulfobaculum xiamenense]